jgi:hypothetical protein
MLPARRVLILCHAQEHEMANSKSTAQQRIKMLTVGIDELEQERTALAVKLHDEPDNAEILSEIQQRERIIDEYRLRIERIKIAEAEVAKRGTTEARGARREARRAGRQRLAASAQQAVELAAKIEQAVAGLALPLTEWQALAQSRQADAFAIGREDRGRGDSWNDYATFNTGSVVTALCHLLVSSGLGRAGPRLDPYFSLTEPTKYPNALSLADSIADANRRLLDQVDGALVRIERAEEAEES